MLALAAVCSSRLVPKPGPILRALWSTSWERVRGSQNRSVLAGLACEVGPKPIVISPITGLENP